MKKSSADKFSDPSAVVLMLIIGATLNPAGLRTYGEESTPTASAPANERTPAPASAIDATIFERPNLTGDWLGARDTLSYHGLTLEISLTQFYQGVVDGGNERDFEYGGKVDYYVNLDGGKAGLWPGFSITTHIETRYGNDVNEIDGMFSLANFNMAFPKGEHAVTGVTALKLTQRLFDHLLLIAGKINTLDDFRLNYTGSNGLDRFMNSAVVANVINGRTIPYSTYGAGFAMFADKGRPRQTFRPRRVADRLVAIAGCALRVAGHASARRQLEQQALHIVRPIRLGERSRSGSARARRIWLLGDLVQRRSNPLDQLRQHKPVARRLRNVRPLRWESKLRSLECYRRPRRRRTCAQPGTRHDGRGVLSHRRVG